VASLSKAKNEMVAKGQLVEATDKYFAVNATSHDFDGSVTKTKAGLRDV
jgi:hypothetical protein